MVGGALVAGAGALCGVLGECSLPAEWSVRIPSWAGPAGRAAGVAAAGLTAVGAGLLTVDLVLSAPALAGAYRAIAPTASAGLGLTLLAVGYLPNAVVAAVGWALGPGVAVGAASSSPVAAIAGARSSIPLLAALPSTPPPGWAVAVPVLPMLVGLLVGASVGRSCGDGSRDRVPAAIGAAGLTALGAGLLAVLAGGRLAAGPFDPITVPAGELVLAVLAFVGVPAVLVARRWPRRADRAEAVAAEPVTAEPGPPVRMTVAELVAQREREKVAQAAAGQDTGSDNP